MYPFFETIRYSIGIAANLFYHQQRVDRTFLHFQESCQFNLMGIDFKSEAQKIGAIDDTVYKCKLLYNLQGKYQISFEPYQVRAIKTFTILEIGDHDYSIKYTDRGWINQAIKSVSTDDVIFTKNGILKDASYTNIVLFDGKEWVTPASPLLLGTKRALLLSENKIIEKEIHQDQLCEYQSVKFINAMMDWDESPTIELG